MTLLPVPTPSPAVTTTRVLGIGLIAVIGVPFVRSAARTVSAAGVPPVLVVMLGLAVAAACPVGLWAWTRRSTVVSDVVLKSWALLMIGGCCWFTFWVVWAVATGELT